MELQCLQRMIQFGVENSNSNYTRLRCFDLYKLHSWAGGLTEFTDGRNQESTSEEVNAYYSATLIGIIYEDAELAAIASINTYIIGNSCC